MYSLFEAFLYLVHFGNVIVFLSVGSSLVVLKEEETNFYTSLSPQVGDPSRDVRFRKHQRRRV